MIDAAFFKNNRKKLGELLDGGLVVLAAYDQLQSTADMAHEFTQEANFWYLTGIKEPRWRLVYDAGHEHCVLVQPKISEMERIFDGQTDGRTLMELSGADEVIEADEFEPLLRQLARKHAVVHSITPVRYSDSIVPNPAQKNLVAQLERLFEDVIDCRGQLTRLRAIKQPAEITAMKKAAKLTVDAFEMVKLQFSNYRHEYEIEADFTAVFRRHNARHAYTPIVASGANATTLHYIDNTSAVSSRELVLIDIGAAIDGYTSDVTRTYALREPTKRQQAVHQAVQDAQKQIVGLLRPGLDVKEYHEKVDAIMSEACRSLNLDAGSEQETILRYMPHAVSHGLGIDVHDVLGGPTQFLEGMVLTVEPGIYLPDEGVGVRIEDDILITAKGHQNLTGQLSTEW